MPRPVRTAALFVAAAALAAQTAAQPTTVAPAYTAFPNLTVPQSKLFDPANPQGGKSADFAALHPRLIALAERPLPPDAPPAARVRGHQLKAAADYFKVTHIRRSIRGYLGPSALVEVTRMANDVYREAAAGEPDAAARRGLVEERVRVLKQLERETEEGVTLGRDPPADLAFIRFHRLAAEGELLTLTERK